MVGAPSQAAIMLVLMMFSLAFSISSLYARSVQQQTKQDFQTKLSQEAGISRSYTSSAVEGYGRLLLSSAALFTLKSEVTKEDWLHFHEIAQMEDNFPSMVGMGYATVVPTDQEKIFERFYRTDTARTRTGTSGHGLGLAIAKTTAERCGYHISVSSALQKGSTFSLRIPKN